MLPQVQPFPPSRSRSEREGLLLRCLYSLEDSEDFLRGWFYGAPLDQIKRENVREWLTEVMFASEYPPPEDAPGWIDESDRYIEAVERTANWTIPPGHTADLPVMRLTLDPIHIVSRPLLWYIVCPRRSHDHPCVSNFLFTDRCCYRHHHTYRAFAFRA